MADTMLWTVEAFITCLTFGAIGYGYGKIPMAPFQKLMILGFVQGFCALSYKIATGHVILSNKATKRNIGCNMLCGIFLVLGYICQLQALYIAHKKNVNAGVVGVFANGTALIGFAASYFIYKDKILYAHYFGFVFAIAGLGLIGFSEGATHDLSLILCSVGPFFFWGSKQAMTKSITQEIGLFSFLIIVYLIGFLFSIFILLFWYLNVLDFEMEGGWNAIYILLLNFSSVFSTSLLYKALHHGICGVVMAISNSSLIITTLMSWFIDNDSLNMIEIIGLVISILGITILSLATELNNIMFKSSDDNSYHQQNFLEDNNRLNDQACLVNEVE